MANDINVTISDQTQVVTQQGFGLCLVVSTTTAQAYKEYNISEDLTSVVADFASNTEVYKIVDAFAAQDPRPTKIAIFGVDLDASSDKPGDLTAALNTLITTNNNWYRLLLEDKTEAVIAAASTWAETNLKLFHTLFNNTTFTTDFSGKNRTVLNYKENTDRIDAAIAGYAASRIPGSFTYKFKTFNGITADAIDPSELANIQTKKMNSYFKKFEVDGITYGQLDNGVVASGKFIDQIESRDWVSFRIQQEIAKLLSTSAKVPYNNLGVQQLVSCVATALNDAFNNSIIDVKQDQTPAFVVNYKTIDKMSTSDRSNRRISGITFSYVELGAVHNVTVSGSVVVSL